MPTWTSQPDCMPPQCCRTHHPCRVTARRVSSVSLSMSPLSHQHPALQETCWQRRCSVEGRPGRQWRHHARTRWHWRLTSGSLCLCVLTHSVGLSPSQPETTGEDLSLSLLRPSHKHRSRRHTTHARTRHTWCGASKPHLQSTRLYYNKLKRVWCLTSHCLSLCLQRDIK